MVTDSKHRIISGPIVSFYLGELTDDRGRYIDEIYSWNDASLEVTHDYIQWLFPLKSRSSANPTAPTLDAAQIDAFRSDPKLRAGLVKSLKLMLRFYGLECDDDAGLIDIRRADNFSERKRNWLAPGNHNYLRITRILTSLRLLGLEQYCKSLMLFLDGLYNEEGIRIGSESYGFWKSAAQGV